MPIYTYTCKNHVNDTVELNRTIETRDVAPVCVKCLRPMQRVIDFQGAVYAPTAGGMR
jgi:predicted nucleic acid-binding Zn ribbon protein